MSRMGDYFERKGLLHPDSICVVEDRVTQKVEIASRIICSKVVQDRGVSDQNVQFTCPVHTGLHYSTSLSGLLSTSVASVPLPGDSHDSSGCDSTVPCFPSLYSLPMLSCERLQSAGTSAAIKGLKANKTKGRQSSRQKAGQRLRERRRASDPVLPFPHILSVCVNRLLDTRVESMGPDVESKIE